MPLIGKPNITLKTKEPAILTEGDTKTLLCVVSDYPKPLITWYKGNTTVQKDPDNSNYTITSANKNHTGTYRCEAVVTAPGLSTYKTSYTVGVIVRCKSTYFAGTSTCLFLLVPFPIGNDRIVCKRSLNQLDRQLPHLSFLVPEYQNIKIPKYPVRIGLKISQTKLEKATHSPNVSNFIAFFRRCLGKLLVCS